MQAFFWAVVRAFTKLGIAIAASKPMMATTIMISTRVKPDLLVLLLFILTFLYSRREHGHRRLLLLQRFVHVLPGANRGFKTSRSSNKIKVFLHFYLSV